MNKLLTLILLLQGGIMRSQECEDYNRALFNMLPKNFPEQINCVDSNGKKQGWWIYYKVDYNPVDRPDELAAGDYVDHFTYGQYKDNVKYGRWCTVENVHQVYESRVDEYYYAKDTFLIKSFFAYHGFNESMVYYNGDSSIIKSISITDRGQDTIRTVCNSSLGDSCKMTYRNQLIKTFPRNDFDWEFDNTFYLYEDKKLLIDKTAANRRSNKSGVKIVN